MSGLKRCWGIRLRVSRTLRIWKHGAPSNIAMPPWDAAIPVRFRKSMKPVRLIKTSNEYLIQYSLISWAAFIVPRRPNGRISFSITTSNRNGRLRLRTGSERFSARRPGPIHWNFRVAETRQIL